MTTNKHTPGPWKRDKYGALVAINGEPVILRGTTTLCSGSDDRMMEAEANTDLAAAAPEFLEALSELVKSNEDHNARVAAIFGKPTGWHDGYLDKARAAIAKARSAQ